MAKSEYRVGLMWHGDREARDTADLDTSKLSLAADAMRQVGLQPEAVVYNDDFQDEVRQQLLQLDAVQVWVNPISDGRDRTCLDALLREVAQQGVSVNSHPDTILRMGTKEVLVDTRGMDWGSDVRLHRTLQELATALPDELRFGARVLKQHRGHSGGGIWKVSLANPQETVIDSTTAVRLRHAQRGSEEETVAFNEVLSRMAPYFEGAGRMVDQAFQTRLADGTIRCYMVVDQLGGFGFQAVNALYPQTAEEPNPQPGQRVYHPPTQPEFGALKQKIEQTWVPELLTCLSMQKSDLPLLWDADFFYGQKDSAGNDTYVLCEINVSSVYPYPDSANEPLAKAMLDRLKT